MRELLRKEPESHDKLIHRKLQEAIAILQDLADLHLMEINARDLKEEQKEALKVIDSAIKGEDENCQHGQYRSYGCAQCFFERNDKRGNDG